MLCAGLTQPLRVRGPLSVKLQVFVHLFHLEQAYHVSDPFQDFTKDSTRHATTDPPRLHLA